MAVRLNIKESLPPSFVGDRDKFRAWSDKFIFFMSIEAARMSPILKCPQAIRQPITDRDVIRGMDGLDQVADNFLSLSNVLLHRLLSCTLENLMHLCKYHSFMESQDMMPGVTLTFSTLAALNKEYTTLKSILTPDWGHQNLSAGQLIKQ
eukprot:2795464-Amphidinium_carterae.4